MDSREPRTGEAALEPARHVSKPLDLPRDRDLLPVAASYLSFENPLRKLGATVRIDTAQGVWMARQRESHSHLRRHQTVSGRIGPLTGTFSPRDRGSGLTCVKIDRRNGIHAGRATNGWLRKRFGRGVVRRAVPGERPRRGRGAFRASAAADSRSFPTRCAGPGRASTARRFRRVPNAGQGRERVY